MQIAKIRDSLIKAENALRKARHANVANIVNVNNRTQRWRASKQGKQVTAYVHDLDELLLKLERECAIIRNGLK